MLGGKLANLNTYAADWNVLQCNELVIQLTLNQRVPGSSPGVPTKQINILAVLRVEHSDNSSPAHSDKFPLSVLLLSLLRAPSRRCSSVSFA